MGTFLNHDLNREVQRSVVDSCVCLCVFVCGVGGSGEKDTGLTCGKTKTRKNN